MAAYAYYQMIELRSPIGAIGSTLAGSNRASWPLHMASFRRLPLLPTDDEIMRRCRLLKPRSGKALTVDG
ncbi:hypothetical protein DM806_19710 [Sphingobium lactosutens]|nr:hypothetical protein [Sphingobium lactosutens]